MANLPENDVWENGIYLIELTDPVQGGLEGIDNRQGRQLANRTAFLKARVDRLLGTEGKIAVFSTTPAAPYEEGYPQGTVVSHQGTLWRANVTVAPGPFAPSQWTRIILAASTSQEGLVRIATGAETAAAAAGDRAIPPSVFGGANRLLNQNGYQVLPGGLIVQWGRASSSTSGSTSISFPIAFPNACFSVAIAHNGPTEGPYFPQANSPTATGFTLNHWDASTGGRSASNSGYIAIGH